MKVVVYILQLFGAKSAILPTWLTGSKPGDALCALTLEQIQRLSMLQDSSGLTSCYEAISRLDAMASSTILPGSPTMFPVSSTPPASSPDFQTSVTISLHSQASSVTRLPKASATENLPLLPETPRQYPNVSSTLVPWNVTLSSTFRASVPATATASSNLTSIVSHASHEMPSAYTNTSHSSPHPQQTTLLSTKATTTASASQVISSTRTFSAGKPATSTDPVPRAGIERINRCSDPLFYFPVWFEHESSGEDPSRELGPGTAHFEPYHLATDSHGVSEKYAQRYFEGLPGELPVFQLEYTISTGLPDRVDADASVIDCPGADCPAFGKGFLFAFPHMDCPYSYCEPRNGGEYCTEAYRSWDDDIDAMRTCKYDGTSFYHDVNMTIIFCPSKDDFSQLPPR